MSLQFILIGVLAVTVTLTILGHFRDDKRLVYIFKPLSTLIVIAIALLSLGLPNARPAFTAWVTVGLVLSLGGDVALMFRTARWFLIGVVFFALAQVVYAIGFTLPNGLHVQDLATGAVLLAVAAAVYAYLRPGLGKMKGPVIVYMLVISLMVNRALSALFGTAFNPTQAWVLSAGAVLFFLSDLLLAINRFRRPFRLERLGLYLYYGGQALIALSASLFSG